MLRTHDREPRPPSEFTRTYGYGVDEILARLEDVA
jgi:hypothetical protein